MRRIAKNSVTVKTAVPSRSPSDENRGRQMDKRVPFFSSIPLIGEPSRTGTRIRRRKRSGFVTAHIVREPGAMARGSHRVRELGIGAGRSRPGRIHRPDRDALRNQTQ